MIVRSTIKARNHVWSQDPGLDRSDEDSFDEKWKQFLKDGDVRGLPTKDGAKLTVFELEPLDRKSFMRTLALSGLEQFNEAVACGLRSVSNFEIDGVPLALERREENGSKRLAQSTLDKIFDPMLFMELGLRLIDLSRLDPTRG